MKALDPAKRRNRRINLTYGTAALLLMTILAIFAAGGMWLKSFSDQLDRVRSENSCRGLVAEDERHATLDLLVSTGTLFIQAFNDPSTNAQAIQGYQAAVRRAQEVNARNIDDECRQ